MFTIHSVSWFTWTLLTVLSIGSSQDVTVQEKCTLNNNTEEGLCILLTSCPKAIILLKMNDHKSLRSMTCGFEGNDAKVCCPHNNSTTGDLITFMNRTEEIATSRPAEAANAISVTNTVTNIPLTRIPPTSTSESPLRTTQRTRTPQIPSVVLSMPSFDSSLDVEQTKFENKIPIENTVERELNKIPVPDFTQITSSANPDIEANNRLPNRTICGLMTTSDKIYGGVIAATDEFPWLARIKYRIRDKEVYACAGSLINDRYVVTAAHCTVDLQILEVRLGEWDSETDVDCFDGICADSPVDIKVVKVIVYPGYDKQHLSKGDIALLQLERSVNYTDFIRPVCLPTTDYIANQDYITESDYVTAGWGRTETGKNSPVKLKLNIRAVSMHICRVAHPSISGEAEPYTICAGGRKGEDTCKGDSGGPLIRKLSENSRENWFLYGITSYGVLPCGSEGRPGLYTRVTAYFDWIVSNITP